VYQPDNQTNGQTLTNFHPPLFTDAEYNQLVENKQSSDFGFKLQQVQEAEEHYPQQMDGPATDFVMNVSCV
jgi:hypothetical protein